MKTRDKKFEAKETKKTNVKRQTKCFVRTLNNSKYMKMLNRKRIVGYREISKRARLIFLKTLENKQKKFKAKLD